MTTPNPRSVLIVEQPGGSAGWLAMGLRELQYEVLIAPDPAHALRAIYEVSPDLVVADISQSGMCGMAEVQWLSDRVAYRPLFVVVGATPAQQDLCRAAGIDHAFAGPVQADRIDGVLREEIENAATGDRPCIR